MPTPDAAAEPRSLPLFLSLDRLSLLRRALIVLGMAGPAVVWTRELLRWNSDAPMAVALIVPAVAAALLTNVNHAGAQLLARGIFWLNLLFGTVVAVGGRDWEPALLALGGGLALLAVWDAGLREGEPTRGAFEPVAFRRSLITSITMAIAEVQILTVGAAFLFKTNEPGYGAGAAACAVLLALATYGIFRLQLWGVLLHLLSMVGVATLVGSAMKHAHKADPVFVWVLTVSVQMLLPMPMLLAIVRRRPVRVGPPSALPARLFAVLVALMMGASVVTGLCGIH